MILGRKITRMVVVRPEVAQVSASDAAFDAASAIGHKTSGCNS